MTPDQNKAFTAARAVIDPQRANDIRALMNWKHGGCLCLGTHRPAIPNPTPEEDTLIHSLWDTLAGTSCWMSALFYVTCPQCQSRVELPDYDARSNQTAICDDCGLAFSYGDPEVRHVAHDLMPDKIAQHIPPLYATEHEDDPLALLKWFTPDSSQTWYITEYDPQERLCFGVVIGHEREMGYFSLDEIESLRGPMGLRVERDLYWKPRPQSECF